MRTNAEANTLTDRIPTYTRMGVAYLRHRTSLYGTKNFGSPMSQKPSASRMAMVMSRTLAVIGNLQENWSCFFRDSPSSLGAGRQPESNEGPPAARLRRRGLRSMGTDVARVERRTTRGREKWRAEVGPMLPGAGARPLRSGLGRESSFERLVFAEIRDGHAERIDGDQFVGEVGLEYK